MIIKKIPNPKKSASKAERAQGLTDYITAPERDNGLEKCLHHEAVNFLTHTLAAQTAEMIALSQEAVKSKDPLDHWVLSWQSDERPTIEQARSAAEMFIKHCGLEGHQYVWGLHDDTENMHVHVAVNRVHQETLKVIKINKGFDREAAQQALALIEHAQGWKKEVGARYNIENGKPVKREQDQNKARKPSTKAQAMEIQTGEKSAQRIGIETAAPIITSAKSWKELHEQMAAAGMQYERKGSGAIVHIGDVPVKASDVSRAASLSAMQKRLGPYQPAKEINSDEYNHHTPQPYPASLREITGNSLRNLSECGLAHSKKTGQIERGSTSVLQLDARADRPRTGGLRRDTGRARQPVALKANQPGWNEYIKIRDSQKANKSHDTTELQKRHGAERAELLAKLKATRDDVLQGNWKGKGGERNAKQSVLAVVQAAEKLELSERHKAERQALHAQYKPLPMYKEWKEQPLIVCETVRPMIDQHITRDRQPPQLVQMLRSLSHSTDSRHHITYKFNGKDVFRDEGRTIQVLDVKSNQGIAAALVTAQQKFGNVLTLTGSPEFQRNAVAVAVAHGLSCKFADPALDKLREQFQAQKYQVERERIGQQRAAERDAETQRRQMKEQEERETVQAKVEAVEPFTSKPLTPAQPPQSQQPEAPDLDRIFNTYLVPVGSENAQYAADLTIRADAKKADQQPSHVTPDMFTGQITVEQMKALDKELDRLQAVAKGAALAIKDNQPRPADELTPTQIDALGVQLAKLSINAEAKQKWPDAAQAFPENQYQGDHWQRSLEVSKQQLADHIKTDRPMFKNKEWDQAKERLETEAANWQGGIEWRQKRLAEIKPAKVAEAIKLHAKAQQDATAKRAEAFKHAAIKLHQVEQQIEATGTALFSQPEPLQREFKQVRELEHQQELEKAQQQGMSRGR